jgi:hypothetical protein
MNELLAKLSKVSGYQKTKERVKLCNGNFMTFIDDGFLRMTSYDHWTFLHNIKGVYVFNNYRYSVTTSKHQGMARSILNTLGISYISYSTRDSLCYVTLDDILASKIESLYEGENALSVSRATKYNVYSESAWNETMTEIKLIQAALKLSDKKLGDMMLEAETKASESLLNDFVNTHNKQVARKEAVKSIQSLAAIQL